MFLKSLCEGAYMVQIDALSTPECQEGVPSHSRWTARGRTWGSPLIVSGPVGNPELYPEHKRSPKSINDN